MTFQPQAPGLGRRFLRRPRAASLRRPARSALHPTEGFGGPRLAAAQAPQLPLSPAPG
ncbi:hypothetical protein MC885_003866 [Smutsia gigantea]|nr:hypothetical protein MC885_003866 [Smutsia gigantea]